jgi:hypothetical protein
MAPLAPRRESAWLIYHSPATGHGGASTKTSCRPAIWPSMWALWSDWRDAAALIAWLDALPPDAQSGDVFARLFDHD